MADNLIVVGKITSVHGVKGWVKIHAYTDPETNIFNYQPWYLAMPGGDRQVVVDQHRAATKGFIAHIEGLDDREQARLYCQREIRVPADQFPEAEAGEIYWHQMEGLRVITRYEGRVADLGTIKGFLETGANDVLVVSGDQQSIDSRERLIPYVDGYVETIDLDNGTVYVQWDPDFE
jgi:16S rRNA processing protein RimM